MVFLLFAFFGVRIESLTRLQSIVGYVTLNMHDCMAVHSCSDRFVFVWKKIMLKPSIETFTTIPSDMLHLPRIGTLCDKIIKYMIKHKDSAF